MSEMDPAVRKETGYILLWVILLSVIMEAVFLILGQWDFLKVLVGNLGGAAAAKRVKASAGLRLIGMGGICALLIGVLHTNVYATVIPLLFPRIGLMFRPLIDKKRGANAPDNTEGSDLID